MSRLKAEKEGERLIQLRESSATKLRDHLTQVLDPNVVEYTLGSEEIGELVNELTAELASGVEA